MGTMIIDTSGGPMESNKSCDVVELGQAWLNENSLTNNFCLAHTTDSYRVRHDPGNERAFIAHLPNKEPRFYQLDTQLYDKTPNKTNLFFT